MVSIILPILLMAAVPPGISPSTPASAAQTDICVSVKRVWSGSLEDTRRISVDPVPTSYRDGYGWTGCQTLDKASLIDWHLAFGSEASTTRALQFLAETALVGMPRPEKFVDTLPVAWREAQRSPNSDAARALVEAHRRFLFLASQYLRAAEFYRSAALLATGTPYFSATLRGLDVFYGDARIALAQQDTSNRYNETLFTGDINTVRDLEMRYAIARARISGSVADWTQAGAIVEANLDPATNDIEKVAFDHDDDYCQSQEASPRLKEACDTENNLSGRLRAFWLNAGLVSQYTDGKITPAPVNPPSDEFDMAMAVISITAVPAIPDIVRYDGTADDKVQLRLARAESLYRMARALPPDNRDAWMLRYDALTDLEHAERLVPVALNPNRFQQIGSLYLEIYEGIPADQKSAMSRQAREATYFRATLAQLGNIAGGR